MEENTRDKKEFSTSLWSFTTFFSSAASAAFLCSYGRKLEGWDEKENWEVGDKNSHQKPARPSAPVNGAIFMGLMPENSITIFAENSITFDSEHQTNLPVRGLPQILPSKNQSGDWFDYLCSIGANAPSKEGR